MSFCRRGSVSPVDAPDRHPNSTLDSTSGTINEGYPFTVPVEYRLATSQIRYLAGSATNRQEGTS